MTASLHVESHNGLVMALAWGIRAGMPRGVMLEDVAQEVRLFILEKGPKFNPLRGAFSTWLMGCRPTLRDRCMHNLCGARKVRRGGRWATHLIRAYRNGGVEREGDQVYADARQTGHLLSMLPVRTERVLACRMMNVTLQAIGEELGVTGEAIRRIEHAGLTRLAVLLGWDGAVGSFGLPRGRGSARTRDSGRRCGA